MKNKPIGLLLPIVFLGAFLAVFMAMARSAGSSNDLLPLNEIWTFRADDRIIATPILIDDQIIFRTADKIYSISAVNGNLIWEATAKASDITINVNIIGKPIVGNSKFLLSEEQGNSIGIYSTKTGEKLWTVEEQINDINALEIVDDVMIVARHDSNLIIYDLTSHEKLWEVKLPPRAPTPVAANTDLVVLGAWDALRIYGLQDGRLLNEKIYDASSIWEISLSGSNILVNHTKDGGDENISSLRLDSLDENWTFHAGKITDPNLSVTDGYLSLFNKTLLLLDTKSGDVLWRGDVQEYYSAPVFHQSSFFFISKQKKFDKNRKMCKVEISKGTIEGCARVGGTGRFFETLQPLGPLATNKLLIIPQDSEITAFTMP